MSKQNILRTRTLGRTGYANSIAVFGAYAVSQAKPDETHRCMNHITNLGVNYIDVAPLYGQAEENLGPWLSSHREEIFLACKTMERASEEAKLELENSLKKLQADSLDLYQLHAVTNFEELDIVTCKGGAIESLIDAKHKELTQYIGITSHGNEAPGVLLEAINRFDFDVVVYPINFIQYSNPIYRMYSETLLQQCNEREIGVLTIKAIAKQPWGEETPTYNTWYKPFSEPNNIQKAIDFVLSQPVSGLITVGDLKLLDLVLDACMNFTPMDDYHQIQLINSADKTMTIFPEH